MKGLNMRRIIILIMVVSLSLCCFGCDADQKEEQPSIPANPSVNARWGGGMCEAEEFLYFVAQKGDKQYIARIKPDGTEQVKVSQEYEDISSLTAADGYVYFLVGVDDYPAEMYALPLTGGKETLVRKAKSGIAGLQTYSNRIYWWETIGAGKKKYEAILSMKPDRSDLKTLVKSKRGFSFMTVYDKGIIYSGQEEKKNNLLEKTTNFYRTDLEGKNHPEKITKSPIGDLAAVFLDEDNIYFVMQTEKNAEVFNSFCRLNEDGTTSVILDRIAYYVESYGINAFIGISGGVVCHFEFDESDSSYRTMNLCRYEIASQKSDIITKQKMINPDKYILKSIKGKEIENAACSGLYIVGDDIYFMPRSLP